MAAASVCEYDTPTVPPGSDAVVMVTPFTTVMVSACAADVVLALSFTVTLKDAVPLPPGVPVMAPDDAFNVSPLGSDPLLTVQLPYGGVPPAAVKVCAYARPTSPLGSEVVVMVSPATTVIDSACAAEVAPALSFTVTLNEDVPVPVGDPVIAPVDAFKPSPLGSDPLLTVQLLYGGVPPVAASVEE